MSTAKFFAGKPVMVPFDAGGTPYNAGDVVILGGMPMVAHEDIPAFTGGKTLDSLAVGLGEYVMTADAAYGVGTAVLYDSASKKITTTVSATTKPFGWIIGGPSFRADDGGPTGNGSLCLVLHNPVASDQGVLGVGAGYKIARGQATTVTASDTIVTGLATVVAAVATLDDAPVLGCDRAQASIGNQAGAPAAGSILLQTYQPTDATHTTPIASTTFGKKVNWLAVGT